MLFRHAASLVDAVQLDGTEASLRAVLAIARATPTLRAGEIELSTAHGRRIARRGSWITRDICTEAIRLYEDAVFQAAHESAH